MQDYVRLLVGTLAFGVSVLALLNQYAIEFVAIFLIASVFLIMDMHKLRASASELDLESRAREDQETKSLDGDNDEALNRLSEENLSGDGAQLASDDESRESFGRN